MGGLSSSSAKVAGPTSSKIKDLQDKAKDVVGGMGGKKKPVPVPEVPFDDTVYNSVGMSSATFFTNTNALCEIKTCELKAVGCKEPYTGKKLKFDTDKPDFDLLALDSEILGWKETVCIVCINSLQTVKMDN